MKLAATLPALSLMISSCSSPPAKYKVFLLDGAKGELVRKHKNEFGDLVVTDQIPVGATHGFHCVSPEDAVEVFARAKE